MSKELISVVIPVYNVEKFLRKCLDSITNQTYKNLEIIIINDSSTDNSSEIIKEYSIKDSRIKSINNKDNMGVSESRNLGIDIAKGQYITFIDSDDFISLDFIETLYICLKENDVNLVIPPIIIFDIKSNHFYKDNYHNNALFLDNSTKDKLVTKDYIFNNIISFNVSPTKLFNLKIIKDNNIYFPKNLAFEDNVFLYNFLFQDPKSEVLYTNKTTYFYIQNNLSAITRTNNKFIDVLKINKLVKDIFVKYNLYEKYQNSINYYMCNHILYWGLNGRTNSLNREIEYFRQSSNFLKQEIDDDYINNTLKQQHKSYYKKIKKIKYNYKSFYYKYLLKDLYKQSFFNKFIRFLKIIIKIISNLSIKKIIKIFYLSFKIILKFISSTPKLIYTTYKN